MNSRRFQVRFINVATQASIGSTVVGSEDAARRAADRMALELGARVAVGHVCTVGAFYVTR